MNCLTPSPKLSHPEPISGKCNIDISSQRCYVSCNNTWNTCLIVCVHFRAILLRIKWKNQDIQYYSVKGLGGRHFNSCIFVLCQLWGQQMVSSQSDQYRRLFSDTLGLLPVVFSNRALGETLVHFLQECPWSCGAASVIWSPLSTRPPQPTYKYCHQIKMFSRQTVCWGTWEKSGHTLPDPNIEYVHHVWGHNHYDHGLARTQELFKYRSTHDRNHLV